MKLRFQLGLASLALTGRHYAHHGVLDRTPGSIPVMHILPQLLAGLAAIALSGCVSLEPRPELPVDTAVPAGSGTTLDGLIAAARPASRPIGVPAGARGAGGVRDPRTHRAARRPQPRRADLHLARRPDRAVTSPCELLDAADRGVKVRLLVDDMDARGKNYGFAALDAHPNIAVRMFNPFESRSGPLQLRAEALGSFSRINRRMHNKTWIADNRIAIVGGRNLGDEYFGASDEVNFVDLDFAMVGPIVRDASASFDRYWNSPLAYPMACLHPTQVTPEALQALRERIAPLVEQAERRASRRSCARTMPCSAWWRATGRCTGRRTTGSSPTTRSRRSARTGPRRLGGAGRARARAQVVAARSVTIISPYFVPGEKGTEVLVGHRPGRAATCAC